MDFRNILLGENLLNIKKRWNEYGIVNILLLDFNYFFYIFFLPSTFVGSAWSFVFLSPLQRPMTSDFEGFSNPNLIQYIYFPNLILEKEPVFSLLNVQC